MAEKYGVESTGIPNQHMVVSSGVIKHDRELWDDWST